MKKHLNKILIIDILYLITSYLYLNIEFGIIFVFSVMLGAGLWMMSIIYEYIIKGNLIKAKIKEVIKGYNHLNRVNKNSYIIEFNLNNKKYEKRINYKTNNTLKENEEIQIYIDKNRNIFIKKDLIFLIPFSIVFIIIPLISFLYIK